VFALSISGFFNFHSLVPSSQLSFHSAAFLSVICF
jgi:hypothetical protein